MRFARTTLETLVQGASAIGVAGGGMTRGEDVIAVGVMWGVRITATPGSVLILTPATSGRVGHPSYGRRGAAIGSKREDM